MFLFIGQQRRREHTLEALPFKHRWNRIGRVEWRVGCLLLQLLCNSWEHLLKKFYILHNFQIPRYACRLCQFTTGEERQMEKHNFCHERNKKYKCHRCSFTSDNKGVVSQHLKRHHDVRISDSEKRAMRYQRPPNKVHFIYNLFKRKTVPNFNLKFKELVGSSTGPVEEEEVGYLLFMII